MSKSNFKQVGGGEPSGGTKYPHDGQRIRNPIPPTEDLMAKVPDGPVASVDKSGTRPSFVPSMAYPAPPAPRKPFKVS
jgi:hypothetical protein